MCVLSVPALPQPAGRQPLPALPARQGARLRPQPDVGHGWGEACWSRSEQGGQEIEEDLKMLFAGSLCCLANPSSHPSLGKGAVGIAAGQGECRSQPQDAQPQAVSPSQPHRYGLPLLVAVLSPALWHSLCKC